MLIMQKMESIHMSENEKHIRDYILDHRDEAVNLTVRELADKIYVSPASLVVFAKKLGFSGWNEFRQSFGEEQTYLDSHFHDIDANVPFTGTDNIMKIANKIAVLQQETISDTLSLIRQDRLQRVLQERLYRHRGRRAGHPHRYGIRHAHGAHTRRGPRAEPLRDNRKDQGQ